MAGDIRQGQGKVAAQAPMQYPANFFLLIRFEVAAVFQGFVHTGAYIRLRFGGGLPTLPPAPAEPQRAPPAPRSRRATPRPVFDPHAFYPDEAGLEFGA